mmetsp:Transcript_27500/g.59097  ORF Transcript_27500/g.59097 Transcript_27500/m.59097 type:complete len:180 (+) Transcript_27500:24-563(+)
MPQKGTEEKERTNKVDDGAPGGNSEGNIATNQPDAETWNKKFLEIMKTAPPAAIAWVQNYFGNTTTQPTDQCTRKMRVLTQEEADVMEAGIPNPHQTKDQQTPKATTATTERNQKLSADKQCKANHSLSGALDKIAKEQESIKALVADLELQGTKWPSDITKVREAIVAVVEPISFCTI